MDISVVFATYENEGILRKTLSSYAALRPACSWELLIVDNAVREQTRQVVQEFAHVLPVKLLTEPSPGKNAAINQALNHVEAELILFTDNDILVTESLLDQILEAAARYPHASIFTGKILPDRTLPTWIDTSSHRLQAAFGIYDKGDDEKAIPPETAWGGFLVARTSLFTREGFRFNTAVGPKGKNYVMGGETELLKRIQQQGHKAVYLPDCVVKHQIRPEQLTSGWLRSRALRSGRGSWFNYQDDSVTLAGVPRFLIRRLLTNLVQWVLSFLTFSRRRVTIAMMDFYYNLGRIMQARVKD